MDGCECSPVLIPFQFIGTAAWSKKTTAAKHHTADHFVSAHKCRTTDKSSGHKHLSVVLVIVVVLKGEPRRTKGRGVCVSIVFRLSSVVWLKRIQIVTCGDIKSSTDPFECVVL